MLNTKHNPANEILKYKFFEHLEHSKDGKAKSTITQYVNSIHELELATNFQNFKKLNSELIIKFKNYLADKKNQQTGDNISKSLYFHYISHVREFFTWLKNNHVDFRKIKIDYLYTSNKDKNTAKATGYQESHTLHAILATIRRMPANNSMELRNRALISLCLLTTPRMSAMQTARMSSIKYFKDFEAWAFLQDPRLLNTKFSKTIHAFFIGQSQDITDNVIYWHKYLTNKGYTAKDYLFPKIKTSFDKYGKPIKILTKEKLQSQTQIREVFKTAFQGNNLPYYKPHSFRHTMARAVKKDSNSTELSIALAQNMGHKASLPTLFSSYAGDSLQEQAKILNNFKLE